jgi:hypothetical protein
MTNTELKNQIDTALNNSVPDNSITPASVATQIKSVVDYVDQEITNAKNYKVYKAIITQNDVNDLEVGVLENTIGVVTVNQFSTGIFLIKLPEGTDLYKVFLPNNLIKAYAPGFCTLDVDYVDQYSNSDVILRTYENINNGFVFSDFILNKTPIEILVYN